MVVFLSGIAISSCNNTAEKKVEEAKEDVNDAKKNLNDAQNNYAEEWQKFKDDIEIRIIDNDKKIAEYRVKIRTQKGELKERSENRLDEIEKKNQEMKDRLNSFSDSGKENWENFKRDINESMDKVGEAFRDLFSDKN